MTGVRVLGPVEVAPSNKAMLAISASPAARRSLLEGETVQSLQATARRPWVPVLLHLKSSDWNRDVAGFERGSLLGQILTGRATQEAIATLTDDPNVIAIEASRRGGLTECATSMPWINVPAVRNAPYGENGAGAIVAIIDGGIDVLHEAFHDGAGKTRILAIWDQKDSSGPTPAEAKPGIYKQNYGILHLQSDLSRYVACNAVEKNLGRDAEGDNKGTKFGSPPRNGDRGVVGSG